MNDLRYVLVQINGTWKYGPAVDGTYTYDQVRAEATRRNDAQRRAMTAEERRTANQAAAAAGGTVLPGSNSDAIFNALEHYNDEPPTD